MNLPAARRGSKPSECPATAEKGHVDRNLELGDGFRQASMMLSTALERLEDVMRTKQEISRTASKRAPYLRSLSFGQQQLPLSSPCGDNISSSLQQLPLGSRAPHTGSTATALPILSRPEFIFQLCGQLVRTNCLPSSGSMEGSSVNKLNDDKPICGEGSNGKIKSTNLLHKQPDQAQALGTFFAIPCEVLPMTTVQQPFTDVFPARDHSSSWQSSGLESGKDLDQANSGMNAATIYHTQKMDNDQIGSESAVVQGSCTIPLLGVEQVNGSTTSDSQTSSSRKEVFEDDGNAEKPRRISGSCAVKEGSSEGVVQRRVTALNGVTPITLLAPPPTADEDSMLAEKGTLSSATTSSSSTNSASRGDQRKRTLTQLISAISQDKLASPDAETKLKILKWLSFTAENPHMLAATALIRTKFTLTSSHLVSMRRKSDPLHGIANPNFFRQNMRARRECLDPNAFFSDNAMDMVEAGDMTTGGQSREAKDVDGRGSKQAKQLGGDTQRDSSVVSVSFTAKPSQQRKMTAQYSDSGFSSSTSNCSYLPPPPPYRSKWKSAGRPSSSVESNDFVPQNSGLNNSSSIPAISPLAASSIQNLVAGVDKSQALDNFVRFIEDLSHPKNNQHRRQHKIQLHRSLSDSKYGTIVNLINSVAANAADRSAALRACSSGGRLNANAAYRCGRLNNPHKWRNWKAARSANSSAHTSLDGDSNHLHHHRFNFVFGSARRRASGSQSSDPQALMTSGGRRFSTHSWTTDSRFTTTNSQITSSRSASSSMSTVSCPEGYPDMEERLHRLAMARDSLSLQIAVLDEQAGIQREKIQDLEHMLGNSNTGTTKRVGGPTFEIEALPLSELSKSTAEKRRSRLIGEIAELKDKYVELEKEKVDAERRLQIAHDEIERLTQLMQGQPEEYANNGEPHVIAANNSKDSNTEMERLRVTVQRLIVDNEQKNKEINTLRCALDQQAQLGGGVHQTPRSPSRTAAAENSETAQKRQPLAGRTKGKSPSPHLNPPSPDFDINVQLRRLLMEEEEEPEEYVPHSSSYPANLCSSVCYGPVAPSNSAEINGHAGQKPGYLLNGGHIIPQSNSYASALATAPSPLVGSQLARQQASLHHHQQVRAPNSLRYMRASPTIDAPAPSRSSGMEMQDQNYLSSTTPANHPPPPFNAIVSTYRLPYSPVARQLAAELDELRRMELQQGSLLPPPPPANLHYDSVGRQGSSQTPACMPHVGAIGSLSLPRSLHLKANSISTAPHYRPPKLVSAYRSNSSAGGEFLEERGVCNVQTSRPMTPLSGSIVLCNGGSAVDSVMVGDGDSGSFPSTSDSNSVERRSKSQGGLRKWLHRKFMNRSRQSITKLVGEDSDRSVGEKGSPVLQRNNKHRRSVSVPDIVAIATKPSRTWLADRKEREEAESDGETSRGRQSSIATDVGQFKRNRTRSTLRNFLGKLGRSTSQDLRLASSRVFTMRPSESAKFPLALGPVAREKGGPVVSNPSPEQFVEWDCMKVCQWLSLVGFGPFVANAQRCVHSGRHLLNMSEHEQDKELGIKSQLHRKKLRCLLARIERKSGVSTQNIEAADRMDVDQVMLWLDDVGLPQYRDIFAENLLDGQMLLTLTARDLVEMGIFSTMHHASIARGIQFLHSVEFYQHRIEKGLHNIDLLERCPIPNEVERWSYSCIAEWLKSIDLAEFTPNTMFSGLHGALMINEPTFTAESLAEILQIPPQKTLLRRHLTTQFNKLLGQEIIARKRVALSQPLVTYLSPSTRVKLLKKGFSLPRKKSRQGVVNSNAPIYPSSKCPAELPTGHKPTPTAANMLNDSSNV